VGRGVRRERASAVSGSRTESPGDDAADTARRSARGGAMMFAAGLVQLLVAVLTTMVLARLLTPADFGLFAMATVALALAGPVRDFGLPFAIVHAPTLDAARLDTLFRVNALLAFALTLSVCAMAPLVGRWFGEPGLVSIVVVLATGVGVRALANVQLGVLTRALRHDLIALCNTVAAIAGASVGIALALVDLGVLALLGQQWVTFAVQALVLWFAAGRRATPSRSPAAGESAGEAAGEAEGAGAGPPSASPLRALGAYARRLSAARLIAEGTAMSDRLIVGRVAGATALGFYQSALRWVTVPLVQLLQPFKSVVVAGFSRLRHDRHAYRRFAAQAFAAVQSLVLPTFAFLALSAAPLIEVLLGDQWRAAIPLMRLLAIAMLFESVDRMANWICLGEGRTRLRLYWNLSVAPLIVGALLIGSHWGVEGVASAFALVRAALAAPSMICVLRGSPLRHRDVWGGLWRPSIATAAALLVVLTRVAWLPGEGWPAALVLAIDAGAFAVVYVGVWLALPEGRRTAGLWLSTLRAVPST